VFSPCNYFVRNALLSFSGKEKRASLSLSSQRRLCLFLPYYTPRAFRVSRDGFLSADAAFPRKTAKTIIYGIQMIEKRFAMVYHRT
jgi:hypothetical protein